MSLAQSVALSRVEGSLFSHYFFATFWPQKVAPKRPSRYAYPGVSDGLLGEDEGIRGGYLERGPL
jgi:hypothetical protein